MPSDSTWKAIYQHTEQLAEAEPLLAHFFHQAVLKHSNLSESLSWIISDKLYNDDLPQAVLQQIITQSFAEEDLEAIWIRDLEAIFTRDGACRHIALAFLFYKGFHALQAYRVAHALWKNARTASAFLFQSRISAVFNVDIHPAAVMGSGIMIDHATGIVIGETARVDDDVSIMQSVTLGGTGKEQGDRHPKIGRGVLISCGAKILGNIKVGDGAMIAAGSVVLKDVAPHTTVAGIPATRVGQPQGDSPSLDMNHSFDCEHIAAELKRQQDS